MDIPIKKISSFSILLPIILLLGLFLRVYHLDTYSLWFDEALCVLQVDSLKNIWEGTAMVSLPPLYYTLLHFWLYIGESEFIVRFMSVIFGALSIYMIYRIGKLLFDRKVGLISAFILSISPFHVYYAQEVKMYTLFPFLVLLSIYFLIKIIKDDRFIWWFFFACSTTLSLYTHYFAFFTLFAENIFFFLLWKQNRRLIKKWLVAQSVIFLLFLPWLPIFLFEHLGQTINFTLSWIPKGNFETIIITFKNFGLGYRTWGFLGIFSNGLLFLLFILGVFFIRREKRILSLLLCLLFVPVFTTFILSQKMHIYLFRYLISASLTYYIIVACAIAHLKKLKLILLLIVISTTAMFSLKNVYLNEAPTNKKNYREAANFLRTNFCPGDIIIHSSVSSYLPFEYYLKKRLEECTVAVYPETIRLQSTSPSWVSLGEVSRNLGAISLDIKDATQNHNRVWLVLSNWMPIVDPFLYDIKKWMDNHYIEIAHKEFLGLVLYLYLPCSVVECSNIPKLYDDGFNTLYYHPFMREMYYKKVLSHKFFPGCYRYDHLNKTALLFNKNKLIIKSDGKIYHKQKNYSVNFEDINKDGIYDSLSFAHSTASYGVGETLKIGEEYYTILSISKDGDEATLANIPFKSNDKLNLSFIINNRDDKSHDYKYEVIQIGKLLEAESFYRKPKSAGSWVLFPSFLYKPECNKESAVEIMKQVNVFWFWWILLQEKKLKEVKFTGFPDYLKFPWPNDCTMVTDVGVEREMGRGITDVLEKEVDLQPGEYHVLARILYTPPKIQAGLHFYANDKLLKDVKNEEDSIGEIGMKWIYLGKVRKSRSKKLIFSIKANNEHYLPHAFAGVDKLIFVTSNVLSVKKASNDYPDFYPLVKQGRCEVSSKESKIINISTYFEGKEKKTIAVLLQDITSNRMFGIYF